jgi:hypothetical protein
MEREASSASVSPRQTLEAAARPGGADANLEHPRGRHLEVLCGDRRPAGRPLDEPSIEM